MFINLKFLSKIEDSDLTRFTRLVAIEFAIHSDARGIVRIMQTELATHIGVSRITIGQTLAGLEKSAIIEKIGFGKYRLAPEYFEIPADPGTVDKELKRLKSIQKSNEGIFWKEDGWPILQDFEDWDGTTRPD